MSNFEDSIVAFIDFLGFQEFIDQEKILAEKFIDFLATIKALDADATINKQGNYTQFSVARSFFQIL